MFYSVPNRNPVVAHTAAPAAPPPLPAAPHPIPRSNLAQPQHFHHPSLMPVQMAFSNASLPHSVANHFKAVRFISPATAAPTVLLDSREFNNNPASYPDSTLTALTAMSSIGGPRAGTVNQALSNAPPSALASSEPILTKFTKMLQNQPYVKYIIWAIILFLAIRSLFFNSPICSDENCSSILPTGAPSGSTFYAQKQHQQNQQQNSQKFDATLISLLTNPKFLPIQANLNSTTHLSAVGVNETKTFTSG